MSVISINGKRAAAIDILVAKEVWPVHYVPIGLRFLWWIGIDVPPPYFLSFTRNAVQMGGSMAFFYGLVFCAIVWARQESYFTAFVMVCIGISAGLFHAAKYKRLKRKYNLPSWDELGAEVK